MKDNLKRLMFENNDNAYDLQEKSGVPQPTTQRFLAGKNKNPNTETVKRWAQAYSISESQLRGDIALFDDENLPPNSYKVDSSALVLVPVVGKAMGGLPDNLFTDEGRVVDGHDEYGEVFSADKNAFITRVDGNSMYPKYHQGGYALIEPNTVPEIEDEVLIKINTGQVMLKKLISRRGGGVVLSSYNDPATHTFSNDEIIWMYYVAYPVPERKIKNRM